MKNLKKVLALVVALTMVLGTVGFAAYTDVAEDAGEYTAVSTLSSLGILTGYEDGSFKPDGDITRAEFAAVVCRALGAKVSGSAVTGFTDVAADHWASAYIAYCAGAGIVNGMGDGTFAPSANVTVEQAVKMLVVALGYEPMATAKGGYPTGYMVVANTNGITEGVAAAQTAAATRAIVSQLVYNALDVPMMVQDGFGTQVSFKVADGKGDNPAYQSLLTGLDVAKLEGAVTGTAIIPSTNAGLAENGYVFYEFNEANDDEYFEEELYYGRNEKSFVVGEGVDADAFFGYSSIIYVRELTRNKYEIIAIMAGEDSETMEFGIEDIDAIDIAVDSSASLDYYTDANKYDTKTVKLEAGYDFYWNYGVAKDITDLKADIGSNKDIEITLIENDGDNKFDVVVVKEFLYDRVDTLELEKDRFDGSNYTYVFDFEDDTKVISIVDKNGDAMDLADFAEDDVIAVISNGSNTNPGRGYDWIEVINLGQNAVTGTVGEQNADSVYVDGTEYGYIVGGIKLGDEGTFFLTRTGKIFDYEKSASVAGNYGYILATDITNNGGWEDAWQIKMLTKDNEIVTYTVRDGFTVNDKDGNVIASDIDQADSAAALLSDLKVIAGSDGQFKGDVAKRIVTYKLDSKGLIRELNKVDVVYGGADEEYNADAEKLFTAIETDAVVFNVAGTKETSAFVAGVSSLVDENEYTGYYVRNEDGEVDCLILTKAGNLIDYTQDLAIVASVTTTKVNEEDAKRVRYYTAGDETVKEIVIMEDASVSEAVETSSYADVTVGAIMMFTDDGNGVATAYTVLANAAFNASSAANSAAVPFVLNSTLESTIEGNAKLDTSVVYGQIMDTKKVTKGTNLITTAGDFTILGTTNAYTIKDDSTAAKARIIVGDWAGVDTVDTAIGHNNGKANWFIAKIVDDKVADIITFSTPFAY